MQNQPYSWSEPSRFRNPRFLANRCIICWIEQNIGSVNSNLGGVRFGLTEDGQPGWKDGADTVRPFSENEMEYAYIRWGRTDAAVLINNGKFIVNNLSAFQSASGNLIKLENYSIIALKACTVINVSNIASSSTITTSKVEIGQTIARLSGDGAYSFIAINQVD